jgi:hypothetical protein
MRTALHELKLVKPLRERRSAEVMKMATIKTDEGTDFYVSATAVDRSRSF